MKINSAERIKVVNGYDKDAYTYIPVIVIGAGESGIAAACQLKAQLGFDQFRVYDRQSGFGGTWWINRYPGISCDVPTPYYSFSFRPNIEAAELYPSGKQLIKYFQKVAAEYGVVDKFQLNTDITEVRWLPEEKLWQATIQHMAPGTGDLSRFDRERLIKEKGREAVYLSTEIVRAKVVMSCVGGLVEPRDWPEDVTGWEKFKGPLMHTARWAQGIDGDDFTGKDVVVVGTGCSAAQAVPRLVHPPYNANSVTQIMRSAPWVIPKTAEPGGKAWYAKNMPWYFENIPFLHKFFRLGFATYMEALWFEAFGDKERHRVARQKYQKLALQHMHKIVPERYWEMLTPKFEILCKRRIIDREWYQGLNDPRITITTQQLTSVDENSVTLSAGGHFPDRTDDPTASTEVTIKADAIVLANGFETTKWLHPIEVYGKDGRSMTEVWAERGGAQAYMCNAMDGFPNFFFICGPNSFTGHQSVILATENLVNYSLKFIRQILSGDAETIEVKKEAEIEWTQRTQDELNRRVFSIGGCVSWYFNKSTGWNSTMYPRSQVDHTIRCWFPNWSHWNITRTNKGLVKHGLSRTLRVLAIGFAIVAFYRGRQSGMKLKNMPALATMSVKMAAIGLLGQIASTAEKLQELL